MTGYCDHSWESAEIVSEPISRLLKNMTEGEVSLGKLHPYRLPVVAPLSRC